MPPQTPYLTTDPHAGEPEYLSRDPNAGAPLPAPATPAPAPATGLSGFFAEATQGINPIKLNAAIQQAFWHPIDTAKAWNTASERIRLEGQEAFKRGDFLTGSRKMLDWALSPLLLSMRADEAADLMQQGQIARGLGATADVGLAVAGPQIVGKAIQSVPVVPRIGRGLPPAERAAVEFGLREGIPVDVATATGNKFLRGAQGITEESLLGSRVGQRARAAQSEALAATGEQLAARGSAAPTTAEQAGQAVQDALSTRAARYHAEADTAYAKLRHLEAQQRASIRALGGQQAPATHPRPFTTVPLAVDIAPTKAAMRPAYTALKREAELVPLMGDKARALTALDRLMTAPDLAPLSIADSALSELKGLARVDEAFRRTAGQGIAADAVGTLEKAVRASAQQAGPDAFRALMEGRAATVNKFKVIDVLDTLRDEPVGTFRQTTMAKDAGIARLRQIARVAPHELRQVGRAYVEDLFRTAQAEGRFDVTKSVLNRWNDLGPETKRLLFRDPQHIRDLDQFFLLARKMAEKPNPSGSGLLVLKGLEGTQLARELATLSPGPAMAYALTAPAIAKLLLSPKTTQVLLQGVRLPVGAKAARAAWAQRLGSVLAQLDAAAVPAPAVAEEPPMP